MKGISTVNEIAKAMWDIATQYLEAAQAETDVNASICYTSIGELALKSAQFAVNNPSLVAGEDAVPLPPGPALDSVAPVGPTQGPKFWGST